MIKTNKQILDDKYYEFTKGMAPLIRRQMPKVYEGQALLAMEAYHSQFTSVDQQDELERIVCAAIWYNDQPTAKILPKNINKGIVVSGLRHGHCIATFVAITGKRSVLPECGEYEQGFITTKDRFVNRIEAMIIAKESGQVTSKQSFEELYSEDLY